MKTLKSGNGDILKWWHNKVIDCHVCGESMLLENGDENLVLCVSFDSKEFNFICPTCREILFLKNTRQQP